MKGLWVALVATLLTMTTQAQDFSVKLWDNTTAPHSNSLSGPEKDEGGERVSNVSEAVLYIYEAAEDKAKTTFEAVVEAGYLEPDTQITGKIELFNRRTVKALVLSDKQARDHKCSQGQRNQTFHNLPAFESLTNQTQANQILCYFYGIDA